MHTCLNKLLVNFQRVHTLGSRTHTSGLAPTYSGPEPTHQVQHPFIGSRTHTPRVQNQHSGSITNAPGPEHTLQVQNSYIESRTHSHTQETVMGQFCSTTQCFKRYCRTTFLFVARQTQQTSDQPLPDTSPVSEPSLQLFCRTTNPFFGNMSHDNLFTVRDCRTTILPNTIIDGTVSIPTPSDYTQFLHQKSLFSLSYFQPSSLLEKKL